MINEKSYALGANRSCIRDLFEYGCQRAAIVGRENIYDYARLLPEDTDGLIEIAWNMPKENITELRGVVKSAVSNYLFKTTRRSPMVIPVVTRL